VKKRLLALGLLLAVLAFSGCALRTVEEMYSLPKRSEEYNKLQSAIDFAMVNLEYSAPISGENRRTLQHADLDGVGRAEYLVFARGETEKPLHLLIFRQEADGACSLMEDLSFRGSAFEQVEYVYLDDAPGCEIVVGRQISDQVMGNVNVFSFAQGAALQLLSADYTKLITCDLDLNHRSEVLIMRPGEANMETGVAVLYNYRDGAIERSIEAEMSSRAEDIRRISISKLYGGSPAVYVASGGRNDSVVTDVFALREDRFANIVMSNGQGASVDALRNYAVYAEDLDNDGAMELPKLINIKPLSQEGPGLDQYLLRWYSIDLYGNEVDKLYTFHNFAGGWYMRLESSWARRIAVKEKDGNYTFCIWNEDFSKNTALFTISELTGNDREYQASQNNRFVLVREENVTYAARLEPSSALYGFTQDYLFDSFFLVDQD